MFIRTIVVPALIICLVLFIGVSVNNGGSDERNMGNNNVTNGGTNITPDTDIATTPMGLGGNNTNKNNDTMTNDKGNSSSNNNSSDSSNDSNYYNTLDKERVVNEIERVNGIKSVKLISKGSDLFIAVLKDENMMVDNSTLKEEMKKIITDMKVDRIYKNIYINFANTVYDTFDIQDPNYDTESFKEGSEKIF